MRQTLSELYRIGVPHSIVLQDVQFFRNPTQTWVQVTEKIEQNLIQDGGLSLARVSTYIEKPTLVLSNVLLDKAFDGLFLVVPPHDHMLSRAAEYMQKRL